MSKSWAFVKEHMPGVVRLLKEKRDKGQSAHVDECWRRGVVKGEAGWFFASEGGVHIGALWPDAIEALQALRAAAEIVPGGALLPLLILHPGEGL